VSKSTLIKWNRECSKEVANLTYFNFEKLIEALANTLNKALDELSKRNFLRALTIPSEVSDLYMAILEDTFKSNEGDRKK